MKIEGVDHQTDELKSKLDGDTASDGRIKESDCASHCRSLDFKCKKAWKIIKLSTRLGALQQYQHLNLHLQLLLMLLLPLLGVVKVA